MLSSRLRFMSSAGKLLGTRNLITAVGCKSNRQFSDQSGKSRVIFSISLIFSHLNGFSVHTFSPFPQLQRTEHSKKSSMSVDYKRNGLLLFKWHPSNPTQSSIDTVHNGVKSKTHFITPYQINRRAITFYWSSIKLMR